MLTLSEQHHIPETATVFFPEYVSKSPNREEYDGVEEVVVLVGFFFFCLFAFF